MLRQEIETRLVPGLLAVDAILLGADAETLARLPGWLDRVQNPVAWDTEFFAELGPRLDPYGSVLLEENSGLFSVESGTSRAFTGYLWEMAPLASGPSLES